MESDVQREGGDKRVRPVIRLWLVSALGLSGVLLKPVNPTLFPGTSGSLLNPGLPLWLALALIAVLILHRVERVRPALMAVVFMGIAVGLSVVKTPEVEMNSIDWPAFLKLGGIVLFIVMAAFVFGLPVHRGTRFRWLVCLVRAPAIAIASPLLLFGTRPLEEEGESGSHALARADFAVFLLVMALAFPVSVFAYEYYRFPVWLRGVLPQFALWAWTGCSLLFILSPWPKEPHIPKMEGIGWTSRIGPVFPVLLVLGAVGALGFLDRRGLFCIVGFSTAALYLTWRGCLALLLLIPWGAPLGVPKLAPLRKGEQIGPFFAAVLQIIPLVSLLGITRYTKGTFAAIFTGELFARPFNANSYTIGWYLDQSTLQCNIWRFTALAAMMLPYTAAVRWLTDRTSRPGYYAFALPAMATCLCLISYMICEVALLLQYIHTFGYTTLRVYGLGYAFGYCMLILWFMFWAIGKREIDDIVDSPGREERERWRGIEEWHLDT